MRSGKAARASARPRRIAAGGLTRVGAAWRPAPGPSGHGRPVGDLVNEPARATEPAHDRSLPVHRSRWREPALRFSSGGGTRTHNLDVNSVALCQLSYPGMGCCATPDVERSPLSTSAWQLEHNSTHLRASSRMRSRLRATPACARPNCFVAGVEMMELERRQAARVTAQPAATSGLGDEDLLRPPPAPHDRLTSTSQAPVVRRDARERARSARARGTRPVREERRSPAPRQHLCAHDDHAVRSSTADAPSASAAPSPCCGRPRPRSARSTSPARRAAPVAPASTLRARRASQR